MKGQFLMSNKEANRISVMEKLKRKEITQEKAGKMIGLSSRQIRRLFKRFKQKGVKGLIHKSRGRKSNRMIDPEEIERVISIIREKYYDFGPTLAHEKLSENHHVQFSVETLRKAMIKTGIWKEKKRKKPHIHQMRERRACLGELVQIDGSPHKWFENRGPYCNLTVFVDDATSKILHLRLSKSETTEAYFRSSKKYFNKHGKPLAFYCDRNSIFRVNTSKNGSSAVSDSNGLTQFGRAMKELGIEIIYAHSPQAKGRVEKLNSTLQDRLVKELRLRKINSIKEANKYLPEFIKNYNKKFAVVPRNSINAHRPLLKKENLDRILSFQSTRTLSKNLTCQYKNIQYQIKTQRPSYAMRFAIVNVLEKLNGDINIIYKKKALNYKILKKQPKAQVSSTKEVNLIVDHLKYKRFPSNPAKARIPAPDHPWKRMKI